jgi:hypothetical protein
MYATAGLAAPAGGLDTTPYIYSARQSRTSSQGAGGAK